MKISETKGEGRANFNFREGKEEKFQKQEEAENKETENQEDRKKGYFPGDYFNSSS